MKRVAVIGGGPVGIEAGALLSLRGFEVTVLERDAPGAHVARWGHVRFFSPWKLNRSSWGRELVRAAGHDLDADDAFPTGAEYLRDYLRPLSQAEPLAGRVRHMTAVRGVTRRSAWKGDYIGNPERAGSPFVLAVESPDGREWLEADVVIDATGTYGTPAAMGPGGLPALGESEADRYVHRWIPEPLDRDRAEYANRTTLVVGEGHSAATTLNLLRRLRDEEPRTRVLWVRRSEVPYVVLQDDPLPERRELSEFGNLAAAGDVEGIEPLLATVLEVVPNGVSVGCVVEATRGGRRELTVDRIVSNVGYLPDTQLTRELQVHHCYASEGPMKLAASLLAQAGNADCLAQTAAGVDLLRNPEPHFFVVGAKSYGRSSNFLLRAGFEQIEAIVESLDG